MAQKYFLVSNGYKKHQILFLNMFWIELEQLFAYPNKIPNN